MWNRISIGLAGLAIVVMAFACGVRVEESKVNADDQGKETSNCVLEAYPDGNSVYAYCNGEREFISAARSSYQGSSVSLLIALKQSEGYRLVSCSDTDRLTRCYMVK